MSAGMEPAGSPVTETDGDFSSPDAPRGTGGRVMNDVTIQHHTEDYI